MGLGLADLIQVVGAGGAALGGFAALLYPAAGPAPLHQVVTNAFLGLAVGGATGTVVAFALWAAIRLSGGLG